MGGQVVHGAAAISRPGGGRLVVEQSSERAILSWQSFSIGQGAAVAFRNGAGATLNRVTGAVPSRIDGNLSATGSVYLVNPAGIVVGTTGRVATGGSFIASTLSLDDQAFLAGGPQAFAGRSDAAVVNAGRIGATGGDVALIARRVENSGSIDAPNGTASLAAGYEVLVSDRAEDGGRIAVRIGGAGTEIRSDGAVRAAVAELRALDGNVYALAGNTDGVIAATGVARRDGRIFLTAGGGTVTAGGRISALGEGPDGQRPGGAVELSGGSVSVTGDVSAVGDGGSGGRVLVEGDLVANAGAIRAGGTPGGSVDIAARAVLNAGIVAAGSAAGRAGNVRVRAVESYVETAGGGLRADGGADGGTISIAAARIFTSGLIAATGRDGQGGRIVLEAGDIDLAAARLEASGALGGGTILLGGGLRGGGSLRHAATLDASAATSVRADAWSAGDGGLVVLWSDEATQFHGDASARGGAARGDGGLIEISSKGAVTVTGGADAGAPRGRAGQVLLDPREITISDLTGVFPQYDLVDPNPSVANGFGAVVLHLPADTVVVTAPNDDAGGADAGAVYLFDERSGALLSTLIGGSPDDLVGSDAAALANGHFVVASPSWDNGVAPDVGAVTWGNGITGISGVVSAANSLVGGTPVDRVGGGGIVTLDNGNYIAVSPEWDNGGLVDAGAATWGDGAGGTFGLVGAGNSLVGSTAGDSLGSGGVTALANGNYVVASPFWDAGGVADAGAVAWADGLGGTVGTLSAVNALVGASPFDQVGAGGVTALVNGHYVVSSPAWSNGAFGMAGAVTWADGTTGRNGTVAALNSLVGSVPNDQVGNGGVTALENGHYVVSSPLWNNGPDTMVGAATWGDGTAGMAGAVSQFNSLIGETSGDQVSSNGVLALANGNYLVLSPLWDDSATVTVNVGAANWGNGGAGTTGTIDGTNALVGSTADDLVGSGGAAALANGHYAVASPDWNNGPALDAGAVTWGDGAGGTAGAVGVGNSLVGSTVGDRIGTGGITALANGHYVVASQLFDNGGIADAGAATWVTGTAPTAAVVSAANSLVGTIANDMISSGGTAALDDGNYVVLSPDWSDGGTDRAGAASWGDGFAGTAGAVSGANSIIGSASDDLQGASAISLSSGRYALSAPFWDNGVVVDAGAVTLAADGATTGAISAVNSMTGNAVMALFGSASAATGDTTLIVGSPDEGRAVVGVLDIDADAGGLVFSRAQGQHITIAPSALTGILNTGSDLALQASNDIVVESAVLASPRSAGGLTLEAGRSILVGADLQVGGSLTLLANAPQADGVVEADRGPGAAIIDASLATLTSGGAMHLEVQDGAGRAANAAGGVLLGTISAPSLSVADDPASTGAIAFSASISTTGSQSYSGHLLVGVPAVALTSTGGTVTWQTEASDMIMGAPGAEIRITDATGLTRYGLLDLADAARIGFGGAASSRIYGDANPDLGQPVLTAGILRPGDSLSGLFAASPTIGGAPAANADTGSYAYSVDASSTADSLLSTGYFVTTGGTGSLTVQPRPITVAADGQSRMYGDDNPTLTFSIGGSGLADGDALSGSLFTAAAGNSPVGRYAITQGSLAAGGNYSLSFSAGELEVTPRAITVTAGSQSRSYGDDNPVLTYLVGGAGLVNGDLLGGTLATGATAASPVGEYPITQGDLAASANYSLTFSGADLTVTPRPLTVTAAPQSRDFGAANPSLTFNVDAGTLAGGDAIALATDAVTSSAPGSYDIMLGGLKRGGIDVAANYDLTFNSALLTVLAAKAADNPATHESDEPASTIEACTM